MVVKVTMAAMAARGVVAVEMLGRVLATAELGTPQLNPHLKVITVATVLIPAQEQEPLVGVAVAGALEGLEQAPLEMVV